MTSHTLRDWFERALEQADPDAWLLEHCPDPVLRAQVARLLAADAAGIEPATGGAARLAEEIGMPAPSAPAPGTQIGPYVLESLLGEGGFARVFAAWRDHAGTRREVALKLPFRTVHSPEAQQQYQREVRALAALEHPNIAHLIDAGIGAGGQAWIALERVRGAPILDHAREARLDLAARLRLMVQVCRAVDAAHRSLIVHRDLKPSNVLVSTAGQVKLLDFGIAKLLQPEDDAGQTAAPAFTPAYAAPEQRHGGAVTTATDVYALGVLLGELVTGERVNDGSGRTPSSRLGEASGGAGAQALPPIARHKVRGDLDAIVMKAIDADPAQRYASAGALAEDLQRLLDGHPVHACAPTRWYRTRKFVARHKGGVAVTMAFVLAVFAALALAVWQAGIARAEAERAAQQTHRATATRDFLVSVFEAAGPDLPREHRPSLEDLVEDAGARALRDAALTDDVRADLLLSLAKVSGALGDYDREHALLDRAETDLARLYAPDAEPWLRARVLRAGAWRGQARPEAALAELEPLQASFAARGRIGVDAQIALAQALADVGRGEDAAAAFDAARRLAAQLPERADELALRVDLLRSSGLIDAQRFSEGLAIADRALADWKASGRAADRDVLQLLSAIGNAASIGGDAPRAEASYREAIALSEQLYARPHPDTAWAVGIYGSFLVAQGRQAEAEPYVERALSMRRDLLGEAHPESLDALAALGRLRAGQGRQEEALAAFEQGVALCERERVRQPVCPRLLGSVSQMQAIAGRSEQALATAVRAVAAQRALGGPDDPQLLAPLGFLARAQVKHGDYAAALETTDELARIAAATGNQDGREPHYARFQRALALFALGRNEETLPLIDSVVAAQKQRTPNERRPLFSMLLLQARALARAGQRDEARAAAREALAIEPKPAPLAPALLANLQHLAREGREP
jgi:hypothetical protein